MAESHRITMPLFPLRAVLFPGGRLPLSVFEPRYLDMVKSCLREESGFGVVLIRAGKDTVIGDGAEQPEFFSIGTEARIIDFNQLENGTLGIVAAGQRKIRVRDFREQPDRLLIGEVDVLPEEPAGPVAEEHTELIGILSELLEHPMVKKLKFAVDYDDARSVSWRLADLLPVEPEIKQSLLQLQWPRERLTELSRLVTKLRG